MGLRNITLDTHQYGPWAIVTGASSGIGLEFAKQLAANGIHLVLVARREQLLREISRDLSARWGIEARVVPLDLTQPDMLKVLGEAVADLDIGLVVSNAGGGGPKGFLDESLESLRRVVELNAVAPLQLARYFGERLVARGRGGLVFVSAMGAQVGLPFMANESGTKAYNSSLGKALNWEFRDKGIHVTVLEPGPTQTPIVEEFGFTAENLPMKPMAVEACVAEALAALKKNKPSILSGGINRAFNRLLPQGLLRRINAKMLGSAARIRAGRVADPGSVSG